LISCFYEFTVTRDLQSFLADLKDTVLNSIAIREEKEKVLMKKLQKSSGGVGNMPWNNSTSLSSFDYGAFLDAKGHYVGFCSGCEKWHTGVVWLQRQSEERRNRGNEAGKSALSVHDIPSKSMPLIASDTLGIKKNPHTASEIETEAETCMNAWERILLSGQYNTDQESMDEAERIGACPRSLILPAKHLLFAKDYIGMALTAGQTFLHLTAAG
jgi:hypothetical protein